MSTVLKKEMTLKETKGQKKQISKIKFYFFLTTSFILFFSSFSSQAKWLHLLSSIHRTSWQSTTDTHSTLYGFSGGLGFGFKMGGPFELEIQFHGTQKKDLFQPSSSQSVQNEAWWVETPVLLRFFLGKILFVSGGIYYAQVLSKWTRTTKTTSTTTTETLTSDQAKLSAQDFGWILSGGFLLPAWSWSDLFLDFWFQQGLSNLNKDPTSGTKVFRSLRFFLGLRIGFE